MKDKDFLDKRRALFIADRLSYSARSIESELTILRHRIDAAIAKVKRGEPLDEHLVTNAAPITREIAIYNLARELRAYEET